MLKAKALALTAAFSLLAATIPAAAETETIVRNKSGNSGGFDYEFWCDTGTATMVLNDNGTFECEWNKNETNNILFRTGKKLGSTQTYQEIGDMTIEYGAIYAPDGNSYLCVYGWTVDPLVEFYVVESWGNWRPPGGSAKGNVYSDGAEYEVYETTRTSMPSIQGTKTFQQYWSVRTEKETVGTISLNNHFEIWESLGMELGKMYEISMCVEGFMSSGTANLYNHVLTIGDTVLGETSPRPVKTTTITEAVETEEIVETSEVTDAEDETGTDESDLITDDAEDADNDVSKSENNNGLIAVIVVAVIAVVGGAIIIIKIKTKK